MLSLKLLVLTVAAVTSPAFANTHRDFHNVHARSTHQLSAREYITPETRLESYDYIIAGGGLAGLVLASRLSENGQNTVLVLEAGGTGDEQKATIDSPGRTYYEGLIGTEFDYSYRTIAQDNAGGRQLTWPRGKILGGSSTVNGMYLVRPHANEINAWHDMIATNDNKAFSDAWTWDSVLASMKKSETFTPPRQEALDVASMRFNAASHGSSGPLHSTFPAFMPPICSAWLPTLEAAGVPTSEDAYNGNNIGGFWSTMAINPTNLTRSYAKSAYIDPLPPRSNLHILANAAVTRILFADNVQDGNQVASGVEFARDASDTAQTVLAKKEVILAGGAVGSPHMLLVSGVGPRDVLEAANVPVRVELPGVGQHMQDHLSSHIAWESLEDTQGDIYNSETEFARSAEFLSFVNSGTSYVPGSFLFDGEESFNNFLSGVKDTFEDDAVLGPLIGSADPTIIAGYRAIYSTLLDKIYPEGGLVEMLYSINAPGQILVQAAIQNPFSQGRLTISSGSIFEAPVLDPRYFSHPADIVIMRQGLKQARRMATLSPLRELLGPELRPGPDVQTDEQIEEYLRNGASTEFHPGCTCAMLPLEQGGVVDASLKVYGTSNLRVIDGSVFPLSMSAHLMAPIYGLAEKAAELILDPPAGGSNGSTGGTPGNGNSGSPNTNTEDGANTDQPKSGAMGLHGTAGVMLTAASAIVGLLLL
ncbi:mala s 12 allergen [Coprinopsis marcescibilis]|uniref:pyranose dehydrogenase (acceptor) n=1 Tax=Coprinopsis marcescibilis TaxID=230819 RepID=A0A5C3L8I1_COPMA|nr:mala s 12 allergen [Coprinopsis marcescibilis]